MNEIEARSDAYWEGVEHGQRQLAVQYVTACRYWVKSKHNNCGRQAVAVLWGKLFDPDHLGPMCHQHLPKDLARGDWSQWAVVDLRPLNRIVEGAA